MAGQYVCQNEQRREAMRGGTLNAIDYLEVLDQEAPLGSPRQRTLLVHCLNKLPEPPDSLSSNNIRIEGGVRITLIRVEWAARASDAEDLLASGLISPKERDFFLDQSNPDSILIVRTDTSGDFSMYFLRLVQSSTSEDPPPDFDPILSQIGFSFKVDCPTDFDCRADTECPPESASEPRINYLAKDYASFRTLMLDRMSTIMPKWKERNAADLGIVLVETLAYAADYLSYYQDAVATEAYLGTARKRVSVRRHARLLDYHMHEGCNARAWVCFEVMKGGGTDGLLLEKGTPLLTRRTSDQIIIDPTEYDKLLAVEKLEVFETVHDVTLHSAHNVISFYTWGDDQCCLPKGATQATLTGSLPDLKKGDVLIFEEQLGPGTSLEADADPKHRHAVRLKDVISETDRLNDGQAVLEIKWADEDALPFPVCLSILVDGKVYSDVSIARGNVVLVDYGRTIEEEKLEAVPESGGYRPDLSERDITYRVLYDHDAAQTKTVTEATAQAPHNALPDVTLSGNGEPWTAVYDLLNSHRFANEFVVEMEEDGRAFLRFGDDVLGNQPSAGTDLKATYRIGNGEAGNVGAEAIAHVVTDVSGIDLVRNPLPAQGGVEPESIQEVRISAPQTFRTQERAVTEADYAEVAERHLAVQKAVATRRWTGSWYTMFITVDRKGGRSVDDEFETELRAFLERYRMAGHDLEIDGPRWVSLDIAMTICVKPEYLQADVEEALLETFSSKEFPNGQRGFFHPDNFIFGQPVYLSPIIATAMQVPGVLWVDTDDTPPKRNRFRRWGEQSHGELEKGWIDVDRLEIARLDNDPNAPENGRIVFIMEGGS